MKTALKIKLDELKLSQVELGKYLGCSKQAINTVVQNRKKSKKLEKRINEFLITYEQELRAKLIAEITEFEKKIFNAGIDMAFTKDNCDGWTIDELRSELIFRKNQCARVGGL